MYGGMDVGTEVDGMEAIKKMRMNAWKFMGQATVPEVAKLLATDDFDWLGVDPRPRFKDARPRFAFPPTSRGPRHNQGSLDYIIGAMPPLDVLMDDPPCEVMRENDPWEIEAAGKVTLRDLQYQMLGLILNQKLKRNVTYAGQGSRNDLQAQISNYFLKKGPQFPYFSSKFPKD